MFTGLIEDIGAIESIKRRGNYTLFTITSALEPQDIEIGESIACDGACLTVVSKDSRSFIVEASQETASKTIISSYRSGIRINLERALRTGDRLGGHYVTGHVDATGKIIAAKHIGESLGVEFAFPASFDDLVVSKGSIAVNGVSLTVNEVDRGKCSVNIIPHTLESTTSSAWKKGDEVNIEFDLIGKYIIKQLKPFSSQAVTLEKLKESGW